MIDGGVVEVIKTGSRKATKAANAALPIGKRAQNSVKRPAFVVQ